MAEYLIAVGSNLNRAFNMRVALLQLRCLGQLRLSKLYQLPCRDAKGDDYWNLVAHLNSCLNVQQIQFNLHALEYLAQRQRPSHQISIDLDIIAYRLDFLSGWIECYKHQPLPCDVILPLNDLPVGFQPIHPASRRACRDKQYHVIHYNVLGSAIEYQLSPH